MDRSKKAPQPKSCVPNLSIELSKAFFRWLNDNREDLKQEFPHLSYCRLVREAKERWNAVDKTDILIRFQPKVSAEPLRNQPNEADPAPTATKVKVESTRQTAKRTAHRSNDDSSSDVENKRYKQPPLVETKPNKNPATINKRKSSPMLKERGGKKPKTTTVDKKKPKKIPASTDKKKPKAPAANKNAGMKKKPKAAKKKTK